MQFVRIIPELLQKPKKTKDNGKFAYVPTQFSKQEFDQFCRLAHIWYRQKECWIVIEELAAVTNCAKASGYWGVFVKRSLGLGATIFATVQRGQEVEKSVMNAASYLWICQHNTKDDVQYMAKKIGVITTLTPRQPLKYLKWSPSQAVQRIGEVRFNSKGNATIS